MVPDQKPHLQFVAQRCLEHTSIRGFSCRTVNSRIGTTVLTRVLMRARNIAVNLTPAST